MGASRVNEYDDRSRAPRTSKLPTLAALLCGSGPKPEAQGRVAQAALFAAFAVAFGGLALKMTLAASNPSAPPLPSLSQATPQLLARNRPDIVDRNGRLLATDIRVYWLYANAAEIASADEAAEKVAALFGDLDQAQLARKFRDKASRFEWVKRGLTPRQAQAVYRLGLPGLHIVNTVQRIYPAGADAAHILGATTVDNAGLGGIEKYIDDKLPASVTPFAAAERPTVKLSVDLGVQHALGIELARAKETYRAQAAMGLLLDVQTGEILALASLPDFDPNRRDEAFSNAHQNRALSDAYELGSIFKSFTVAMALDAGIVTATGTFDTATPVTIGRFTLRDAHAGHGRMSVEDIFVHSSNTGAARIAIKAGPERQREFLARAGLFDRLETEAGGSPKPRFPKVWRPVNAVTIAYGHGISVPPLSFAAAAASLVNGGTRIAPTFLPTNGGGGAAGARIMKPETSDVMRDLMRQAVLRGTGKRAAVPGLGVGGKTGTAWKVKGGHYTHDVVNSFIAAFPIEKPRYLLMVTLDEPKPETPGALNEASANAAPAAGAIITRIAPMLGLVRVPQFDGGSATPYERPLRVSADLPQAARKKSHEAGDVSQRFTAFDNPGAFAGRDDNRAYGR